MAAMRTRWFGSAALSLLLLLTATVGVAGHDHATEIERASYACALEHEDNHGAESGGSGTELIPSGERHLHHCRGCRHGSLQVLLLSVRLAAGASPRVDGSSDLRSPLWASTSWTGRTLRGPPSA